MRTFFHAVVFLLTLAFVSQATLAADTLITLKNGKPAASVAKSWKKSGNSVAFTLAPKAMVGSTPATPAIVKTALDGKLGDVGGSVTTKGNVVVISFAKGKEKALYELLSRTSLAAPAPATAAEIALDTTASDSGIRAKTADRPPEPQEIKGTIVAVGPNYVDMRVVATGGAGSAAQIANGNKVRLYPDDGKVSFKRGETVFATPSAQSEGGWKSGSLTQ